MKTSLIITVRNEAGSIRTLLDSIVRQTVQPTEVLIADAASSDATKKICQEYISTLPLEVLNVGNVNRSVGRNKAIKKALHPLILITDAGCRLDRHWVEQMIDPFKKNPKLDVLAGYYAGDPFNVFEACVVPYVLVMPDQINPSDFLPATRSIAIKKEVWMQEGGLNANHAYGEDYAFMRRLKRKGYTFGFTKEAIVRWRPRNTIFSFGKMIFLLARGDAQNKVWRPKITTIYGRYAIFGALLLASMRISSFAVVFLSVMFMYMLYVINKHYRYVRHPLAFLFLPLLQITADVAVMSGTLYGLTSLLVRSKE